MLAVVDGLEPGDPRQAGDYRLVARLGGGGMGQVFLGVSPGGRPVAVKVVRAGLTDPEYRARFAREVDAARRVGGFHTAAVVDADPGADRPWMATAYIEGPSLHAVVTGSGPLTPAATAALGAALAEGLAAIHGSGLVHRDLKPSNIIMASDGPRIIDFGIAAPAAGSGLTTPGTVIGTYAFMSPEQFRDQAATPASDVFALGCVLGFAATGRAPFDAASVPAIMYRVLEADPDLGGIPSGQLRDIIGACLAKDPLQRPPLPGLLPWLAAAARTGGEPGPASVLTPHTRLPAVPVSVSLAPEDTEPAEPSAAQSHAERHESITIRQIANAAPGSVVIQVAGNAKIGDEG